MRIVPVPLQQQITSTGRARQFPVLRWTKTDAVKSAMSVKQMVGLQFRVVRSGLLHAIAG
jgi:hypothetical protein